MNMKSRCWPLFWPSLLLVLVAVSCRTPPPVPRAHDGPVRIALVSDTHVQFSTNAEQKLYLARFDKTIQAVNAAHVDLVLVAGDLTEHGWDQELEEFLRRSRRFHAPVWCVPGNHDVGGKRMKGAENQVGFGRVRDFELACGRSYWAREVAGVRVIGVNASLLGSHLPQRTRLWNMLEKELAQPTAQPTLILMHYPPFLKKADERGGDYFNVEPYPRARLLALAKQGGVEAILSGHLHHALSNRVDNIELITTPPVSFGLPKGKQPEGWTLVTVSKKHVKAQFQPLPKMTKPTGSAVAYRKGNR